MASVSDYTDLVTSEHASAPKFMATVSALAQCFVDLQNVELSIPFAFDLDQAVGVQLDAVGEWVGISRNVNTPLTGVYFSFDTVALGFDQGVWKGPFDPDTGVVSLDDATYRLLIRAKIGANNWDGTLGTSAAILNSIFNNGNAAVTGPVSITAINEPFGTGDGATSQFQLKYQGQPLISATTAQIFRNDWQGNQRLYLSARTNSYLQSVDLTNAVWSKQRTSLAALTGPDGSSQAVTITATGLGGTYEYQSMSVVAGQQYPITIFACAGSIQTVSIHSFTPSGDAAFNLVGAGSVGPVSGVMSNAQIVALGGGWYQCTATLTATATGSINVAPIYFNPNVVGDTASFFGPMFGGTPTSGGAYIPTTTVPATVTDYVLGNMGIVSLASSPSAGAALSWSGSGTIYPAGTYVFIQDNGDMSITYGIAGTAPSALFLALLRGGYIPLKPEAVHINGYYVTSNSGSPLFGFDVENNLISGFDVGAWGAAA